MSTEYIVVDGVRFYRLDDRSPIYRSVDGRLVDPHGRLAGALPMSRARRVCHPVGRYYKRYRPTNWYAYERSAAIRLVGRIRIDW